MDITCTSKLLDVQTRNVYFLISSLVKSLFFFTQDSVCESTITIEKIVSASYVLLGVNSAVNFVIYMLRGDKFRRVLARKVAQLCSRAARSNTNSFDSPR